MVGIEAAGKHPLLVKILVRHRENQMPPGPNQSPPFLQRRDRVVHVLEAVRGIHVIELLVDELRDAVGVAIFEVEASDIGCDRIRSTADINPFASDQSTFEVGPDSPGFRCFIHVL